MQSVSKGKTEKNYGIQVYDFVLAHIAHIGTCRVDALATLSQVPFY